MIKPSFYYLKVFWQTFWLARPKILDCPWAPLYSLPLHSPSPHVQYSGGAGGGTVYSGRRLLGGGGNLSPHGASLPSEIGFLSRSNLSSLFRQPVGWAWSIYTCILVCVKGFFICFFHRKAGNKIGRETGSEGRFCRQWKVPNRPWFLAESAVKACGDLATLTRELSNWVISVQLVRGHPGMAEQCVGGDIQIASAWYVSDKIRI